MFSLVLISWIFWTVKLNCLLATTAEARTRGWAPGRGKRIAVIRINANGEAVADIDTRVTARTGAIRTGEDQLNWLETMEDGKTGGIGVDAEHGAVAPTTSLRRRPIQGIVQ